MVQWEPRERGARVLSSVEEYYQCALDCLRLANETNEPRTRTSPRWQTNLWAPTSRSTTLFRSTSIHDVGGVLDRLDLLAAPLFSHQLARRLFGAMRCRPFTALTRFVGDYRFWVSGRRVGGSRETTRAIMDRPGRTGSLPNLAIA
jgi:hypothetical protein